MMRKVNQFGVELIKYFEGFSAKPYNCINGYKTIGYGHKLRPDENVICITEKEGEELLIRDLKISAEGVARYINADINDNQFAALASFAFNLGVGALQRSTLRQKINYGASLDEISNEFQKWVFCSGIKVRGLIARRRAEAVLYYNG